MFSFSQLEFSLAPSIVEKPPGRDSVLEALARATSSSSRAQPLWPRRFVLNGRLVFAPPPAARNIMLDAIEALERHVATSPVVITAGAGASFQVSTLLRTAVTNVGINGSAGGATRSDALPIDPPVAINISPNTVPGGMAINGVIQLNGTAPAKPRLSPATSR